ncbi:MAG: hypothetical protein HQL52_14960 [Magnetococcales bacterium]|nr:hypothetical protein [Magnetococcales bacterium]
MNYLYPFPHIPTTSQKEKGEKMVHPEEIRAKLALLKRIPGVYQATLGMLGVDKLTDPHQLDNEQLRRLEKLIGHFGGKVATESQSFM